MKAATGEVVTAEELGGGDVHTRISGVVDHLAEDDEHALEIVRRIVGTLSTAARTLARGRSRAASRLHDPDRLLGIVPLDAASPTTYARSSGTSSTAREFQEFKALYGETLLCAFARIDGQPVGILANNGILFSQSALKGAHFIELC